MEKNLRTTTHINTRQLAVVGMLSAISIILGATGLGFIPIPPAKATIMHIPVIIGAIVEGPMVGALIGLMFGVFSVIQSVINPTPLSPIFMNPLVSVLPRVLIGIVSYYCYISIKNIPFIKKSNMVKIGITAAIGTLTNTIGVLGMMYILYVEKYAQILHISSSAAKKGIIAIGATNGLPEITVSILITIPVVMAVKKLKK
ncbi:MULTISPECIES: ECF transporter S component [unclassified Clostridium]|uniref:ECF transporter S component n=1 Tax=unclassified Clostridium TaxID=2614128 RepID=UPI00052D985E|nr:MULTISPECIES: ECF transporter S component [unclassified Clostridium]KGK87570.1 membrane protein [Clostridium sp. HMP27]